MSFENCGLWQRALTADDQTYTAQLETLRATYRRFWTNGCHLAGRIAADLPGLTLHDESHFSALWERADQIAGDGLVLTPLEAFVFGGAILLHDAANTVSAFPGGLDEVQASPEWRDAVATLGGDPDAEGHELSDELRNNALLTALRSLHAKRAEGLGNFSVTDPTSGQVSYLIQDDVLRTHLGPVIGQIAASHHWDIEELEDKLQSVVGAPMGYPHQWRVRPVLLACLLRCADAIQLDQTR